ncbi:MAG: alanine--tRNA ligase [Candidatus Altiarchaeales archaeon ex4484_96]|nr:MAG: alanine--tRNA ligase [Candidatus Altiarchaeales archaeon ex4484_96]
MTEYELKFFNKEGFTRKKCPKCGKHFWTQAEREDCGEPPCSEYSFIGDPPTKKKYGLNEMREIYLSFFEKHNHERISRYPVVARWRDDIFYSIASISCFQPWVLNGTVEPPANPLVMSQTALRFNDIDNVGKTGRHFTFFEMMAHHAFNTPKNEIYFKDETVELCHNLLLELGIAGEDVTYIEDEWAGGGNSGPCFETIVDGVELATLVFMMYEDTPSGKKQMSMQVVDTGYGLERFAWVSQGTSNAYEAVMPDVLNRLKKELNLDEDHRILGEYSKIAGMMNVESNADLKQLRERVAQRIGIPVSRLSSVTKPFEDLYAVGDHTKALTFMFNDGVVPSNVKEGYFARLLVRRTLRSLNNLGLDIPLKQILDWHISDLKKHYSELGKNRDDILKLAHVEEERYDETVKRGKRIVKRFTQEKKSNKVENLTTQDLIYFYDSHGLVPELVEEYTDLGVDIPDDFFIQVAAKHTIPDRVEAEDDIILPSGLEPTELAFYGDERRRKFKAKIVKLSDNYVILDKTFFYPEGGGQETDQGMIGGKQVTEVLKKGNIVLHRMTNVGGLEENTLVECEINWERRIQLMKHHTATHIINGAAKRVLGNHIWQAGAHKSEDLSRLDITHYASLSDAEIKKIESLANKTIKENRPIEKNFMNRNVAEEKYGFTIYQGGAVPGKDVRIVNIKNWDVEACGGTHFDYTGELDCVKIIRAKRIQDGVIRLEYKAGAALERHRMCVEKIACEVKLEHLSEEELNKLASVFSVSIEKLPKTLKRFQKEWQQNLKIITDLEDKLKIKGKYSSKYDEIPQADTQSSCEALFSDWKSQQKDLSKLKKKLMLKSEKELKTKIKSDYLSVDGVKIIRHLSHDLEVKNLNQLANSLLQENMLIILGNTSGMSANVIVASDSKYSAVEIANEICARLGGGASGNKRLAVGGGSSKKIKDLIKGYKP